MHIISSYNHNNHACIGYFCVTLKSFEFFFQPNQRFFVNFEQVKLLISMALGLISCLAKILPQAVGLCCALVSKNIGWAQGLAILMGQLTAIVGVAWTSMKLYQSFHCESHIWNLTTGCVPQEIIERNS